MPWRGTGKKKQHWSESKEQGDKAACALQVRSCVCPAELLHSQLMSWISTESLIGFFCM